MSEHIERAVAEHRLVLERQRQEDAELLARLGGRGHAGPVEIVQEAALALMRIEWSNAPMPATSDLLAAGKHLKAAHRHLEATEVSLIEALLDSGMTWEQLAEAFGRSSRQGMQQRYRRIGGERTWPTRSPATES